MIIIRKILVSVVLAISVFQIAIAGPITKGTISSSKVLSINQDKEGYIWIGTIRGLNKFTGSVYQQYLASDSPDDIANDYIIDICVSSDSTIWLGTRSGMIKIQEGVINNPYLAYNVPVFRILEFGDKMIGTTADGILSVDKETFQGISVVQDKGYNRITVITVSSAGDIWFLKTFDGKSELVVLDKDLSPKNSIPIPYGVYAKGILSTSGKMFVATDKGLLCFDEHSFRPVQLDNELSHVAGGSNIHFVKQLGPEKIIIGVKDDGMYIYDLASRNVVKSLKDNLLTDDNYLAFVDRDMNVWLSNLMEAPRAIRTEPLVQKSVIDKSDYEPVKSIHSDPLGRIWYATYNTYGLYDPFDGNVRWSISQTATSTGFVVDDSSSRMFYVADHNKIAIVGDNGRVIPNGHVVELPEDIISVQSDKDGDIWVHSSNHAYYIRNDGNYSYENVSFGEAGYSQPSMLQRDNGTGEIYFTTIDQRLYKGLVGKVEYQELFGIKDVSSIFTAKDGTMWLGTSLGMLYHIFPEEYRFDSYDVKLVASVSKILSIIEDRDGNIWFNSDDRIIRLRRKDNQFQTLTDAILLDGHFYESRCSAMTPDGRLHFGSDEGIVSFMPSDHLFAGQDQIPLKCISVTSGNVPIDFSSGGVALSKGASNLSFVYSGINFTSGSLLNYAHILEGYDKDWIYTNEISAIYSQLKPGKYVFKAKVRLFNGEWSASELSIPVVVKAPFYFSFFAKVLYCLASVALLAFVIYILRRMRLQRQTLEESERNEKIRQEQINFITNTSHEFRTPLSLVYAPLKQLSESGTLDPSDKKLLSLALSNAERLRTLSERLLKQRIDSSEEYVLHVSPCDISGLVRSLTETFLFAAHQKNIEFKYDIQEDVFGYVDAEKVEKVLMNILSNAFKYTPDGKDVKLAFSVKDGLASVEVADHGIGVPEQKVDGLFKRYDRLGREKDQTGVSGSGIGLNYALQLARLSKGDITYHSNDISGSVFCFSFPVTRDSFREDEIDANAIQDVAQEPYQDAQSEQLGRHSRTVILAEDNLQVRMYLKELLSPHYNVIACSNGAEAWDNIGILAPDIVLSDVVMPFKNGYELCSEIKKSEDYFHIPVILLTAKTDVQSNIAGLDAGADAYIPKPFDPAQLLATIRNLLENRARIQQKVGNLTASSMKDKEVRKDPELNSIDRKFLEKLQKAVENHLNEESFSVEQLSEELKLSHSGLYSKVKMLTGSTPQSYIIKYRMNVAMEMLKTGEFTVSEVADSVGASSISNFSRDFKKHFGVTPSSV